MNLYKDSLNIELLLTPELAIIIDELVQNDNRDKISILFSYSYRFAKV